MRILESTQAGELLAQRGARMAEAEAVVRPILDDVRSRGDAAVFEYSRKFDSSVAHAHGLPTAGAAGSLPPDFRNAVELAAANVRAYAELQMPHEWTHEVRPGVRLGQIVRPLNTIAAYVPSGRYPLPSTVVMTVVPAQVAGVPNICIASPRPPREVLGTAEILGIDRVYRIGGAQAIAAFAFGTETVPRADRIVGPGNIYVAAAKKLLAGEVGIDFVAGPTEILMVAVDGEPRHIAADMLAQTEHDTDASAVLLTTSRPLAAAVAAEVERQLSVLPTAQVAREAIERNSAAVIVGSLDEAMELANRFAPEHLSVPDASLLAKVKHAGSVFIGPFSPEAAGDYVSGPNHVLPTSGAARVRGGLSVMDYLKIISVQELSPEALNSVAPAIATLARAEGLEAHARSVEVRIP
jgi:histidinol dehydrogenase